MDHGKYRFPTLVLQALLLGILTQAIHEAGHVIVFGVLGRGPTWGFTGLVQFWGENPSFPAEWVRMRSPDGETGWLRLTCEPSGDTEYFAMVAAGPLASLLGVIAGFALSLTGKKAITRRMGLLLCMIGSLTEGQYFLRAPFQGSRGDGYYIAEYLGIHRALIEIPLAIAFIGFFALCLRALGTWRNTGRWMAAFLVGCVPASMLMMQADRVVRAQIDLGNPLFQPVLGFALPVALVNCLAAVGLAVWWMKDKENLTPPS